MIKKRLLNKATKSFILKLLVIFILFVPFKVDLLIGKTASKAIVKGQIHGDKITRVLIDKKPVPLDSSKGFVCQVDIGKPKYIEVTSGKTFVLYLKPGDRIECIIDTNKDTDPVTLKGDGLGINKFLIRESIESEKNSKFFNANFKNIVSLSEKDYLKKINEIWQPFKVRLETFIKNRKIEDSYFIKTQRAMRLYSKANILIRYPGWFRWAKNNPSFKPSDQFFNFFTRLDLNDPGLWTIEEYRDFLNHYLAYKSGELSESNVTFDRENYRTIRAKMQVALNTFKDPLIRSEMLYSFMYEFIDWYYHKGIDDLVQMYFKNTINRDHIETIKQKIRDDKAIRDKCITKSYKKVNGVTLDVFIYLPPDLKKGDSRPALAFFHGGGWECGKPEWGHTQCSYFSKLGMVAASFEYRLATQHGATPLESVIDAKSAIRWLRENAGEYGIDPARIVASGYSAGGHLAACTAMSDKFDEPGENKKISSAANAMMFWVTPFKISADGWFTQLIKDKTLIEAMNPLAHVRPGLPPSIIFQGTNDDTVPFWMAQVFAKTMQRAGNRCYLHLYKDQTHLGWGKNSEDVLQKMDAFLKSIGYLEK